MKVFVPVPAVSEANRTDEHWTKKKRRHDDQKEHTWAVLRAYGKWKLLLEVTPYCRRWRVHLEVHHWGRAMDTDNLVGSVKWYRDEVARFLGVDDGDTERVQFSVSQTPVGRSLRGVEITIEELEGDDAQRKVPA
jgi:hypothetical protein